MVLPAPIKTRFVEHTDQLKTMTCASEQAFQPLQSVVRRLKAAGTAQSRRLAKMAQQVTVQLT